MDSTFAINTSKDYMNRCKNAWRKFYKIKVYKILKRIFYTYLHKTIQLSVTISELCTILATSIHNYFFYAAFKWRGVFF